MIFTIHTGKAVGTAWVIYYILISDIKENVSVQNQEDTENH